MQVPLKRGKNLQINGEIKRMMNTKSKWNRQFFLFSKPDMSDFKDMLEKYQELNDEIDEMWEDLDRIYNALKEYKESKN